MKLHSAGTLLCGLLILALFTGCGDGNSAEKAIANANKTNIQRLSNLYARHQMQNSWVGPKDEAGFKTFIQSLDATTLKNMGVDVSKLDALFVSERDSEPFDIVYGAKGDSRGSNQAVIFEKTGVNGTRQVGFTSMAIKEISDDAEIASLKSGKPPSDSGSTAPTNLPAGAGR